MSCGPLFRVYLSTILFSFSRSLGTTFSRLSESRTPAPIPRRSLHLRYPHLTMRDVRSPSGAALARRITRRMTMSIPVTSPPTSRIRSPRASTSLSTLWKPPALQQFSACTLDLFRHALGPFLAAGAQFWTAEIETVRTDKGRMPRTLQHCGGSSLPRSPPGIPRPPANIAMLHSFSTTSAHSSTVVVGDAGLPGRTMWRMARSIGGVLACVTLFPDLWSMPPPSPCSCLRDVARLPSEGVTGDALAQRIFGMAVPPPPQNAVIIYRPPTR
ncbi:hypothetical protein DFH09DRAFT_259698 [Mycena vulgaris]|nr:hypothetical protein DFH09DRAFT_259698 [Mycena vulgaris]